MARRSTIIMDLTERCNLKCIMCHFSATDRLSFPPHNIRLSEDGNMPVPVFERIAADLFPRARRVALACAAEPMIHPKFKEIVAIAGRHRVPELWFPTNLLALTEATANALVDARVWTVAASIDGVTKETYEKIRVPAKFERLVANLELLARVKAERRSRLPQLRIIFTWMKSNRQELRELPSFAQRHGAVDLDVRYVTTTSGVDNRPELLSSEDAAGLRAELASAARDAVRRGLRLTSYPEFETKEERPDGLFPRLARRLWRIRAGIDRWELLRHAWNQRQHGCAYPGRYFVVRPNGAVNPCIYWEGEPIGIYPGDGLDSMLKGAPLARIRNGLHFDAPIGTCATCGERRGALYRLPGSGIAGAPLPVRLPTLPR